MIEALLSPFDAARRGLLLLLGRPLQPLFRDRDARVTAWAMVLVLFALVATAIAPIVLLALGPIVLGVPHVISDVRYLVVQPGLHRLRRLWLVAVPLVAVCFTSDVRVGLLAPAVAIAVAPAPLRRKAIGLAVTITLIALAYRVGSIADLFFVQAHNFVAVGLWWALRPARRRTQLVPVALFVAASLAIGLGALDPILRVTHGFTSRLPFSLGELVVQIAPTRDPSLGLHLVLLYAFAQSVHYAVWLRLVPEDARPRTAPRSFSSSFRALRADLGGPVLAISLVSALALAGWAVFDLCAARDGYLRAAQFHGHLELAAIAFFATCGRRREVAAT
jgi:hypothetical protein